MRIITRKLYRAFAELDAYSDGQCKQYLANIRQKRLSFSLKLIVLPLSITLCYFILVPYLFGVVMRWLSRSNFADMNHDRVFYPIILSFMFIWWVGSAVVALVSRDFLLGGELRKLINNQLQITRCRTCSYSLIGQTPDGEVLVCPECGTSTTLEKLGITEEDLIPPV